MKQFIALTIGVILMLFFTGCSNSNDTGNLPNTTAPPAAQAPTIK